MAILVLVAAVVLMGQAPATRTVEANQFILKDEAGKVRGNWSTGGLWLHDENETERLSLLVSGDSQHLALYDQDHNQRITLAVFGGDASLMLWDSNMDQNVGITLGNARAELALTAYEPLVSLADRDGFKTVIGTTDLVTPRTGETHKTSAASVVLFDKDKKVFWKAP